MVILQVDERRMGLLQIGTICQTTVQNKVRFEIQFNCTVLRFRDSVAPFLMKRNCIIWRVYYPVYIHCFPSRFTPLTWMVRSNPQQFSSTIFQLCLSSGILFFQLAFLHFSFPLSSWNDLILRCLLPFYILSIFHNNISVYKMAKTFPNSRSFEVNKKSLNWIKKHNRSSSFGPILSSDFQCVFLFFLLSQSTVSSSRAAKPSVPFGGGTWDKRLVCDRPFAPLLCICSLPRAPVQHQYVGNLVWPRKVYGGSFSVVRGQDME